MTDVLDELREAFARYSWGHYDPFSVIDAFAAEHPGLIELVCCDCGGPVAPGRLRARFGGVFCPTCAKEAGVSGD